VLTPLLRLKYHNSIADAVADPVPRRDRQGFHRLSEILYQDGSAAAL
jgi:hypothetical protein